MWRIAGKITKFAVKAFEESRGGVGVFGFFPNGLEIAKFVVVSGEGE